MIIEEKIELLNQSYVFVFTQKRTKHSRAVLG
jgi:hypothetical protein